MRPPAGARWSSGGPRWGAGGGGRAPPRGGGPPRPGAPCVVVQDAFLTETAQAADVVLPALVIPEKHGTVANVEGRVQRIEAAVLGPGGARGGRRALAVL